MSETTDPARGPAPIAKRPQASPRVGRLIEQIRQLVAEQRRLEDGADGDRLEACRAEIACLQRQLASAVRRELSESGAASHA